MHLSGSWILLIFLSSVTAAAYWSREGRESIDAIVLFGALLAMGTWGAPLLRWMVRRRQV